MTDLSDELLNPYLNAVSEADASEHLERLMRHAEGIIQAVVRRKLGSPCTARDGASRRTGLTREDLCRNTLVQILTRLEALRRAPTERPIISFSAFVSTAALHACNSYLREIFPQRSSLKNKLTYLLTRCGAAWGFALWQGSHGERYCGLRVWMERGGTAKRSGEFTRLLEDPHSILAEQRPGKNPADIDPGELLSLIFESAGGPVLFEELVDVVASLWNVQDEVNRTCNWEQDECTVNARSQEPDLVSQIEQRVFLERLWAEIRQLPPRQCAAVLLNLRDTTGAGVIALLPILGIAGPRDIAQAMGMKPERFASLWNDLPLDDEAIAALLECTRQQVINLRKVARERLTRRMRSFGPHD